MADDAGLWPFTLRFYGAPGVAPACLTLQERHQADVPLLIFAAWVGAVRRAELSPQAARAAVAAVADWHAQIVRPLRVVRQRMKTGPAPAPGPATQALRDALKAVEVGAEKIELGVLESLAPPPGNRPARAATAANLAAALSLTAGPDLPEDSRAALDLMVQAALALTPPPGAPTT